MKYIAHLIYLGCAIFFDVFAHNVKVEKRRDFPLQNTSILFIFAFEDKGEALVGHCPEESPVIRRAYRITRFRSGLLFKKAKKWRDVYRAIFLYLLIYLVTLIVSPA